jgi:hypothetical protein
MEDFELLDFLLLFQVSNPILDQKPSILYKHPDLSCRYLSSIRVEVFVCRRALELSKVHLNWRLPHRDTVIRVAHNI